MAKYKWRNGATTNYRPPNLNIDPTWPSRRVKLEAALLGTKPHLASQRVCGICPDCADRPKRKVKLPNGLILFSSWYKVPTTEADHRKAMKEQICLWYNQPDLKRFDQEYVKSHTGRTYWLESDIRAGRASPLIEAICQREKEEANEALAESLRRVFAVAA